jgi:hypothetical protein
MLFFIALLGCIQEKTTSDSDYLDAPDSPSAEEENNENNSEENNSDDSDTGEENIGADSGDTGLLADQCDDAHLLDLDLSTATPSARIWRYDISTQDLDLLTTLNCPFQSGDYPVAMTANHKGELWLISRYGYLFRFLPNVLECSGGENYVHTSTDIAGSLAFVRADASSPDMLYFSMVRSPFSTSSPGSLGIFSPPTTTIIGETGLYGYDAYIDLAGTGDGQLFGLRPEGTTSALVSLNTSTGSVLNEWSIPVAAPQGWSLVFMDGEFWLFTSTDGMTTEVHFFDPSNNDLEFIETFNFQVVGAALPTCAPQGSGS